MYEHLSVEQRTRLIQLQGRTVHTISEAERKELQALQASLPVVPVTPPGQQVSLPYDGKDWGERQPHLGEWVVYYSRPGEGKNAKTRFPAQVMDDPALHAGRWRLNLAVHWDAVDSINRIAYQRSPEDRYGTWDYLENPMFKMLMQLAEELKDIKQRLNGNGRPSPPRPK